MDKKKDYTDNIIKYGGSFLLVGFLCFYMTEFLSSYSITHPPFLIWVYLLVVALFVAAGFILCKYKKTYAVLCFVALLCIYSLRVIPDLYRSYLWCEDGTGLFQESMRRGPFALFDKPAGYFWFVPRLVSLISYWICLPFGSIKYLPQLQGFLTKLIATVSVFYFFSGRFEWLVKSRVSRFFICVLVVISIPTSAYETVPADVSLPFVMNFTPFLIGLDALFGPEERSVTVFETIFLSLLALSTASAPFCAAVAVFACVRWLWVSKGKEEKKKVAAGVICTVVVTACSLFQTITTLLSPREISDLSLLRRMFVCARDFVFFPYLESYKSVLFWIVALLGWIIVACLAKTSWKIVLYTAVYAYGFLFYCSMVGNPDYISWVISSGIGARYFLVNYMTAFFLLGVHINNLFMYDKVRRTMGAALCMSAFVIAGPTYLIGMPNPDLSFPYAYCVDMFDLKGGSMLVIPIAPETHYRIYIPADFSGYEYTDSEPSFDIETIGEQDSGGHIVLSSEETEHTITGWAADDNGEPFEYIFYVWEVNNFEAPTEIVSRSDIGAQLGSDSTEYGFIFDVDTNLLERDQDHLSFIGITSDGRLLSWSVSADIIIE